VDLRGVVELVVDLDEVGEVLPPRIQRRPANLGEAFASIVRPTILV
jgi:hypothetical protein